LRSTGAVVFSEGRYRRLGYETGDPENHVRSRDKLINPQDREQALGELRRDLDGATAE
jgi:hypothetical protein